MMAAATEIGSGRTVLILSLVIGCFAVLWPKIFYPMLQASLSSTTDAPYSEEFRSQERPQAPMPHAAAAAAHAQAQNLRRPQRTPGDRPRPMPGMRPNVGGGYGGFVQQQPKGNGAMGIIMPIYTIGIVVFFIYTIMRVMLKKNDKSGALSSEADERPVPAAAPSRYRVQPDTADGRSRQVAPAVRREQAAVRRHVPTVATTAAPAAAAVAPAPDQPAAHKTAERAGDAGATAAQETTSPPPAIPLPAKAEEAEIDQLRRRLEDTERAMERIMKQMSSVSHKLNAAKISSNIRALKEELWGSVDSLASESCATDYSVSLDSRAQVLTDPSLWTYSLDSRGYTQSYGPSYGPSEFSLDVTAATAAGTGAGTGQGSVATAPLASAVSRLCRSVSQLSLELETAPPADDEVSLPAETGAELSELPDAEDELDTVDELKHDGENAVRRFASLEALQRTRAVEQREPAPIGAEEAGGADAVPAPQQGETGQVLAGIADVDVKTGVTEEGLYDLEAAIQEGGVSGVAGTADGNKASVGDAAVGAESADTAPGETAASAEPTAATSPVVASGEAARSTVSPLVSELRTATCPHSFPSGISSPTPSSGGDSALATPRVIVLGLRTKRTPEREPPRSITFRLGGEPGHELASCHADGRPPESAVMIRETETRARRARSSDTADGDGGAAGAGLETKLELEVAGMEVTSAPPRSAWAARLHAAVRWPSGCPHVGVSNRANSEQAPWLEAG